MSDLKFGDPFFMAVNDYHRGFLSLNDFQRRVIAGVHDNWKGSQWDT